MSQNATRRAPVLFFSFLHLSLLLCSSFVTRVLFIRWYSLFLFLCSMDELTCKIENDEVEAPASPHQTHGNIATTSQPAKVSPCPSIITSIHPPNHLSIGDMCLSLEAITVPKDLSSSFEAAGKVISQKKFTKLVV